MRCIIYISFILFSHAGFGQLSTAQLNTIDSLKRVLKSAKHDSTIVNAWNTWDNIIYLSDPVLDFSLNKKIDSVCAKNIEKALTKKEKSFFLSKQAFALNNFGAIYQSRGDYAKAIKYYTNSLTIRERIRDKENMSNPLNNIGIIYAEQKNFKKAIEYFTQSIKIIEETGRQDIGPALNNIGLIYKQQGDYATAFKYFTKSLEIWKKSSDQEGISYCLNNIGIIYQFRGDSASKAGNKLLADDSYGRALDYYHQSLNLGREIGNQKCIAVSLTSIGNISKHLGDFKKAIESCAEALVVAQKMGAIDEISQAALLLWELYRGLGNYKQALQMHELYISSRDSIASEENHKEVIRQEYKYQYEKQVIADSIKHAEEKKVKDAQLAQQRAQAEKQETELKNKRFQQYILFGGLGLLLLFAGFVFNRFRLIKKQKIIIEEKEKETNRQKEVIEEKQREIIDSINYAKRIQLALLPSQKLIARKLEKMKPE